MQRLILACLNFTIALAAIAFLACLLFGFVTFINARNAFKHVQGVPYHTATFEVLRPYYQRSSGMRGPDVAVYASGMVEGKEEWMDLLPYLKRVPRDQNELNDSVPPGKKIAVYLFPSLKGQSRVQVIGLLPPGETSRQRAMWVLQHAPVALAILGALILLLVKARPSCASS